MRAKRGLVAWWTVAATIGVLLIAFTASWRGTFINPAPLSQAHAVMKCADCHTATTNLMRAAVAPAGVDCLRCHTGHDFHNAKAPFRLACTACHNEHSGPGKMPAVADSNCAHCHGDAGLMKVVFTSFAKHPAFHPSADINTLKFNHQKHLTGEVPLLNGHKLDCADCHKPDSTGTYMQPITYDANCRSCHALQFDAHNPELFLPHGNATAVRAFLHSLPTQYADLARKKNLPVEEFVTQQMLRLRDQARTGEDLERQVFFNTRRPGYLGCALCHEVKAIGDVTPPILPARWMTGGRFNHAKHATLSCEKCHDARGSRETGDVLLPDKANCVSCHRPTRGASDSCATCHTYHKPAVTLSEAKGLPPHQLDSSLRSE